MHMTHHSCEPAQAYFQEKQREGSARSQAVSGYMCRHSCYGSYHAPGPERSWVVVLNPNPVLLLNLKPKS